MKFTMIKEDDESKLRRLFRWILKQIAKLGRLIARIINAVITVPACNLYAKTKLAWVLPILALLALAYFAAFGSMTQWWMKNLVVTVSPWNYVRGIRTAQAAEVEWPDIGDCEQYRSIVQKYFGKLTDEALFVAKHEGGCIADRIGPKNSDGSKDYCTFQITREPLAAQSLEVCVRRAKEKYVSGRIGKENWSDFYAVCLRNIDPITKKDLPPIPKYPKVISNCS